MAESRGGSGLSKRLGGIPVWVYGLVGVGVVGGVLYVRHKNAAAAVAASSAATTTPVPAAGPQGYQGTWSDQGAVQSILAAQQGSTATATTAPTSPYTLAPGQQAGTGSGRGGYNDPLGLPLTDAQGNTYLPFADQSAATAYENAGNTLYNEIAPGIFTPAPRKGNTAARYYKVPATTTAATSPGTPSTAPPGV